MPGPGWRPARQRHPGRRPKPMGAQFGQADDLAGSNLCGIVARAATGQPPPCTMSRLADARLVGANLDLTSHRVTAPRAAAPAGAPAGSRAASRHSLPAHSLLLAILHAFPPAPSPSPTGSSSHRLRRQLRPPVGRHSGTELRRFDGHTGPDSPPAFSPDGHRPHCRLRPLRPPVGRPFRHRTPAASTGTPAPFRLRLLPDGHSSLTVPTTTPPASGTPTPGAELRTLRRTHWLDSPPAPFPNGQLVLTAAHDNSARLWDARSRHRARRFDGHTQSAHRLRLPPTGSSSSPPPPTTPPASGTPAPGTGLRRFDPGTRPAHRLRLLPDGQFVLTPPPTKLLPASGTPLPPASNSDASTGHTGPALRLFPAAFSPRRAARPHRRRDTLRPPCGTPAPAPNSDASMGRTGPAHSACAFSPTGSSSSPRPTTAPPASGTPAFRHPNSDASTGTPARSPPAPSPRRAVRPHRSGTTLRPPLGRPLRHRTPRFDGHQQALTPAPSPRRAARPSPPPGTNSACLGTFARVPNSGASTDTPESLTACAFPDGQFVLTASDDNSAASGTPTPGAELRRFDGHSGPSPPAPSPPTGQFVPHRRPGMAPPAWNTRSGTELRRFDGHTGPLTARAFPPTGNSSSPPPATSPPASGTPRSGTELRRFDGHTARSPPAPLPDGLLVLTAADDSSARLWDAHTGAELRRSYQSDDGWLSLDVASGRWIGEDCATEAIRYVDLADCDPVGGQPATTPPLGGLRPARTAHGRPADGPEATPFITSSPPPPAVIKNTRMSAVDFHQVLGVTPDAMPPRSSAPTSAWPCAGTRIATRPPGPRPVPAGAGGLRAPGPSPSGHRRRRRPPNRPPREPAGSLPAAPTTARTSPSTSPRPPSAPPSPTIDGRDHPATIATAAASAAAAAPACAAAATAAAHAQNGLALTCGDRRPGLHHRHPLPPATGAAGSPDRQLAVTVPPCCPAKSCASPARAAGARRRRAGRPLTSPCAPALTPVPAAGTTTSIWRCR